MYIRNHNITHELSAMSIQLINNLGVLLCPRHFIRANSFDSQQHFQKGIATLVSRARKHVIESKEQFIYTGSHRNPIQNRAIWPRLHSRITSAVLLRHRDKIEAL